MQQLTMCIPVANSQQVAKLACIMLRIVTPGWIRTCEFATGLHIVGNGICALLEMRAETVQKWTPEIQWKR